MIGIREAVKSAAAVLSGAALYAALNFIPLMGPISAGAFVGYSAGGGFGRGFRLAFWAAALGAAAVFYLVFAYGLGAAGGAGAAATIILGWMLLVWNAEGVLLAALGGGFGALGKDVRTVIPPNLFELFGKRSPGKAVDYLICPTCGQGNQQTDATCGNCGQGLR
jgi:hypothetical protein